MKTLLTLAILNLFTLSTLTAGIVELRNAEILCQTPYNERAFSIEANKVAFHDPEEVSQGRSVSSVEQLSVNTLSTPTGFTKTLYFGGNKHKIVIKDLSQFNELDDYISLIDAKGHTVTYPLNCKVL